MIGLLREVHYTLQHFSNYIGFGKQVQISSDGNLIAVIHQSNNYVTMFSWDGSINDWQEINGISINNSYTSNINTFSLSKNGSRVAMSYDDLTFGNAYGDNVEVYDYDGNVWNRLVQINSGFFNNYKHLSLSNNGNVLAIG